MSGRELTPREERDIQVIASQGETPKRIAALYGVSAAQVRRVIDAAERPATPAPGCACGPEGPCEAHAEAWMDKVLDALAESAAGMADAEDEGDTEPQTLDVGDQG